MVAQPLLKLLEQALCNRDYVIGILIGGYEPPRPQRLAGAGCVNICVLIALWDKKGFIT